MAITVEHLRVLHAAARARAAAPRPGWALGAALVPVAVAAGGALVAFALLAAVVAAPVAVPVLLAVSHRSGRGARLDARRRRRLRLVRAP